MKTIVWEKDGQAKTTSKIIADVFGKIHRDVIRAINNLECSDKFRMRTRIE